MQRFENKVILVTGAASGIGLATAQEFAKEGGKVIATDIDQEALEQAHKDIDGIETAVQDATDEQAWKRTVNDIVAKHGSLDVLFNNAGGAGAFARIDETTPEILHHTHALNIDSVFFGMQAAIDVMKNQETGGSIINNSSVLAMIGEPILTAYCGTKGAVRSLTKATAIDMARRGLPIRINSVHPGLINTALVGRGLKHATQEKAAEVEQAAGAFIEQIPVGRMGEPIEIARPVLFLASGDASYITGAELVVDGGMIAA